MVIHCFDGGEGEEQDGGSRSYARKKKRQNPTNCVKEKPLQGMIVQSPKCIGYNKTVMLRMDMLVQELAVMHVSVHKVLPSIHDQHSSYELSS